MKKKILTAALVFALYSSAYSQVENVPVANPVYSYLTRAESKGLLKHFSMTMLPLTRGDVEKALIKEDIPFYDKMSNGAITFSSDVMKIFDLALEIKINKQLAEEKIIKLIDKGLFLIEKVEEIENS